MCENQFSIKLGNHLSLREPSLTPTSTQEQLEPGTPVIPTDTPEHNPTLSGDRFIVRNGKIYDPSGNQFIVKGVTAIYGAFAGGDVKNYGMYDYDDQFHTYQGDLAEISRLGANLIRLMVAIPGTVYYDNKYADYYGTEATFLAEVDNVVSWVRAEGMIAYIIPHHPEYEESTVEFLIYLANKYKNDPYVWIGTSNEPDKCADTACWENWQYWHNKYVGAIRASGYENPIVINGVYWSGRLDRFLLYPLHDQNGNQDMNLIYGPHKYGNYAIDFWMESLNDVEQYRTGISDLPNNPYAVIVDEYGACCIGTSAISHLYGFQDYITEWVLGISEHSENDVTYTHSIGGDGAIAFTWRWSDRNTMVDKQGFELTEWGRLFYERYLQAVDVGSSSPIPRQITTPIPVTSTITP